MIEMRPTNRERYLLSLLTLTEIRALDFFRATNGPAWRRKLQGLWEKGGLESETNGDALQRVRNIIGPSGLWDLRVRVLEAAANGEAL